MILGVIGAPEPVYAKKKSRQKTTTAVHGIDISHHNGNVEWEKLKKEHGDIQFVYIKATEGASWRDDKYASYLKHARKQGFKVGSYHFFNHRVSAKEQFNNFKSVVESSKQDIIPMVDFENFGTVKEAPQAVKKLKEFCELVKKHYGVYPMVYTTERIYNERLINDFKRFHLFIAKYKSEKPQLVDDARYTIWQYSDRGKLDGMKGYVDLSRFHPQFSLQSITYNKKSKK